MKCRGFTLIELVMTLIVVGVLAVYVAPKMSLLNGFDDVGYRDKVAATLQFARKTAVAQRRHVCVQLSADDLTLTIDDAAPESTVATCSSATALNRALNLPATDSRCGGALNKICNPTGVTLTGTVAAFSISPSGQPTAGVIYTVTGPSALTVVVEAETGYVR